MIIVRMHNSGEAHVNAETWQNDGDGDLECLKDDEVVAAFPRGYWCAVYESGAVTFYAGAVPPATPAPSRFPDH